MVKMIALIKRRPDFTHEQFREYYETHHVALAKRTVAPFFSDYRRNYTDSAIYLGTGKDIPDGSDGPPEGYDCVTEMWFEGDAFDRLQAALAADPDMAKAIEEDEARFMDRSKVQLMICKEVR